MRRHFGRLKSGFVASTRGELFEPGSQCCEQVFFNREHRGILRLTNHPVVDCKVNRCKWRLTFSNVAVFVFSTTWLVLWLLTQATEHPVFAINLVAIYACPIKLKNTFLYFFKFQPHHLVQRPKTPVGCSGVLKNQSTVARAAANACAAETPRKSR